MADIANFGSVALESPLQRLQAYGQQQQIQLQQQQFAAKQAQEARAQAAAAQAGQLLNSGDTAGARRAAIGAGQNDLASQIGNYSDDQRAQLKLQTDAVGAAAQDVLSRPPQEQAAAWQYHVNQLKQAGIDDHEIQQLSDPQALRAAAASALTVQQQIDNAKGTTTQQELASAGIMPGTPEYQSAILNHINPAQWQFDSESGSWLQRPGTGPQAFGQAAPQQHAPTGGVGFDRNIAAESGGRQFGPGGQPLTSSAGAVGIAQVMPSTGPEAARAAGLPWDPQRFASDPQYNRALGEAYYAEQLARFNGDPQAASAAYNAGPGRAARAGAPQTQGDWRQNLPPETQAYIQKVAPGYAGGGQASQPGQAGVINVRPAKQKDAPAGYQWNGSSLQPIPGGPADPNAAGKAKTNLTEGQSKATAYYARANLALQQLAAVKGAPPPGAAAQFADELPLGIGQHFISDANQQQLGARRAFIAAVLRQESGAAIAQSEFNSYNKLYFPQTGDSPQVVRNKAALRQSAVDSLRIEAGPGAGQMDRQQPTRQQASSHPPDIDAILRKYGVH